MRIRERSSAREVGTIKTYSSKGFGFIIRPDGVNVFFHISEMPDGIDEERIRPGVSVEFTSEPDWKNPDRVRAADVVLL